jgi:hypothetical protein
MGEPVTRFYPNFYQSPVGKIAIVTMDNGYDYHKPNTFSEPALASLGEALDAVLAETDVKGLMLSPRCLSSPPSSRATRSAKPGMTP